MLDREPSQWQVARAVMQNIREAQGRAEGDSLRFIALIAAFLVIRGSAASTLSVAGLQIDDLRIIQFAIVPLGAFLALRYARAQALTASLAKLLGTHLGDHLPAVPKLVCPPDWDILRNVAERVRPARRLLTFAAWSTMYGLVVTGVVINSIDATSANSGWAILSAVVTIIVLALTPVTLATGDKAVIGGDAA